jgi:MFS family permease
MATLNQTILLSRPALYNEDSILAKIKAAWRWHKELIIYCLLLLLFVAAIICLAVYYFRFRQDPSHLEEGATDSSAPKQKSKFNFYHLGITLVVLYLISLVSLVILFSMDDDLELAKDFGLFAVSLIFLQPIFFMICFLLGFTISNLVKSDASFGERSALSWPNRVLRVVLSSILRVVTILVSLFMFPGFIAYAIFVDLDEAIDLIEGILHWGDEKELLWPSDEDAGNDENGDD